MLTVLFDLDDTLLSNEIDQFQKHYFKALGAALSPWVSYERMMMAMQAGIKAMLTKIYPQGTMETAFDSVFYPGIGVKKEDLKEAIADFYKNIFPELQQYTSPRPEAQDLVKACVELGWDIVIATNPLFPSTAIHQRLEWAGLSPKDIPFSLVTVFEEMHYSKPHTAYYAEILSRLRWPKGPVVIVGNNYQDDIIPMQTLGYPAYWVSENGDSQSLNLPYSTSGSMDKVLKWLKDQETINLQPTTEKWDFILATLQATPAAFDQFGKELPVNLWNIRPGSEEWSFTELIYHLRDVDGKVNIPRLKEVIETKNPFVPGVNTDIWTEEGQYHLSDGSQGLIDWMDFRTQIIKTIYNFTQEEFKRPARHAIFGPTHLLELIGFIATHDRVHIKQAWDTIRKVKTKIKDLSFPSDK